MNELLKKTLDVYGGAELWSKSKFVEAEVSASGLLFTLKRRPTLQRAKIIMQIAQPYSKITPIGKKEGVSGILDGKDTRLENYQNETFEIRENARKYFPYGRRLLYWDDLDMAYFSNYAFWNYFTFPRLIINDKISWDYKGEGKFTATFPDDIPYHSKTQDYFIDTDSGKLIQQNYTAEVVAGLATAAHVIKEHNSQNNVLFPSRRIVTPQGKGGSALKLPVLVDITVHNFKLT